MEAKLHEILVLERWKIRAEDSDLFIIEFFEDVWSSCETKYNPCNRRRSHAIEEEEECCPAIRSAIIICAIS
jgi:hypothetical protein